jgi:hypothetical protein
MVVAAAGHPTLIGAADTTNHVLAEPPAVAHQYRRGGRPTLPVQPSFDVRCRPAKAAETAAVRRVSPLEPASPP